jgi:hypothetical protein
MPHPYSTPPRIGEASSVLFSRGWRELTNKTDEFPDEGTCFFAPLYFGEPEDGDLLVGFERLIEAANLSREVVNDPNR